MIKFENVTKVYKGKSQTVQALDNVNLTINKGDIFGVIGHSGAGKSTLIRTVNLLERPSSGQVLVQGKNLAKLSKKELRKEQKNIGMIFQHFHLLNSKTVYDNVALPLVLSKVSRQEINKRVKETLEFVGLLDKIDNYPDQLSGGQKQRVGIARALVTNPDILLCDEATSALDPQTTISILNLLKKINEQYNITILMITHQMEVIKEICHRVAVMEEGRIIESNHILDIVTQPQTETTRNFVRSIVQDDIPPSILKIIQSTHGHSRIFQFKYLGVSSDQPVISTIAKNFDVKTNILHGNITEIQGTPFGNLLLILEGPEEEIEKAIEFSKEKKVHIQEVIIDGDRT